MTTHRTTRPNDQAPALALACALAAALWLHSVPTRAEAGWLVVGLWPWTALAVLAAVRDAHASLHRVLGLALGARLLLVGTPPWLSDDLYRYLWEGLALRHGVDVFSVAPGTVIGLDDALRDRVNHSALTSIYPPLALAWFRLLDLGGTAAFAQALTGLVDVGTAGVLHRAQSADRQWSAGVLWALHPLAVLESAHGAHLDVLAVALLALAVTALSQGSGRLGSTAAAAAVGVKLFPLAILLPLWRARSHPPRGLLLPFAALLALSLWASWPCLAAGDGWFDSLHTYAQRWRFNGALEPWLRGPLGEASRVTLLGLGAALVGASWLAGRPLLLAWRDAAAAFLLVTPTAHPWYALWLLAPAVWTGSLRWVLVASAPPTAYLVLLTLDPLTGAWREPAWLWWLTWTPALAALALPEPWLAAAVGAGHPSSTRLASPPPSATL